MMRITNTMMADNVIRNINNNMQRLNDSQEENSTGEKIQQASEDPIAATKGLKYRSYIAQIEQYQSNATDATSWMTTTEDALSSLTKAVQQIRDLTSEASSDALSGSDYTDIASEISELEESTVEFLNTQYAGRYVFAGYNTDSAPYELTSTTITDSTTGEKTTVSQITFKGSYLSKYGVVSSDVSDSDLLSTYTSDTTGIYTSTGTQAIKYNTGYSSDTAVNVEGQNVSGTGADNLFNTINKLLLGLADKANGDTPSYKSVASTLSSSAAISASTTNQVTTSDTLATMAGKMSSAFMFGTSGDVSFTINGTSFTFASSDTLEDVVDTVNDADIGATLSYDTSSDKLVLTAADTTGSLTATDSSGTFAGTLLTTSGTSVTTTKFDIDDLLDDIDANLETISVATSGLGARMNYVETCTSRLATDYTTYTGLLSSTLDADLSVSTTEYATAQTIYDASLTVGAKVITKTLVDYLT